MYAQLKQYEAHISSLITSLKENPDQIRLASTIQYHTTKVREFQHERLIHLLVTFFFGFLLLISVAGYLVCVASFSFSLLHWLILAIVVILFFTELAYIRHYYQLENGTQRLYRYTDLLNDSEGW